MNTNPMYNPLKDATPCQQLLINRDMQKKNSTVPVKQASAMGKQTTTGEATSAAQNSTIEKDSSQMNFLSKASSNFSMANAN